jgi:putative FmdB family regulatory protein
MPIYEYECKDCGEVFERLQSSSAGKTGEPCLKCGGRNTERVLSTFAARAGASRESQAVPACSARNCPNTQCRLRR